MLVSAADLAGSDRCATYRRDARADRRGSGAGAADRGARRRGVPLARRGQRRGRQPAAPRTSRARWRSPSVTRTGGVDLARLAPFAWDEVLVVERGTPAERDLDAGSGYEWTGDVAPRRRASLLIFLRDGAGSRASPTTAGWDGSTGFATPVDALPACARGAARARPRRRHRLRRRAAFWARARWRALAFACRLCWCGPSLAQPVAVGPVALGQRAAGVARDEHADRDERDQQAGRRSGTACCGRRGRR